MFRFFESRVEPFPPEEPSQPPPTLAAFCWQYTRPVAGWLLVMAVLSALIAVGEVAGDEELRAGRGDTLRTIVLKDRRIVGFRLAGDVRGAGAYRALMLRGTDVADLRDELLDPGFGLARLAA